MRHVLRFGALALAMLMVSATPAVAQVNIGVGIGLPGLSIGINVPTYPQLVAVPGYPVYYAPNMNSNYFFYDGMYWVYENDNWYASSWYNGPWSLAAREAVPLYVLRVPVRYYRHAPVYFRGWRADAPPRWGDHWGRDWEQRHAGWDHWNRNAVPRPAPLPTYQRQYSGNRYPQAEQQPQLHGQYYGHRPADPVVQQHYQQQGVPQYKQAQPMPPQQRYQQGTQPAPPQQQRPQQQGGQMAPGQGVPPQHDGGARGQPPAPVIGPGGPPPKSQTPRSPGGKEPGQD